MSIKCPTHVLSVQGKTENIWSEYIYFNLIWIYSKFTVRQNGTTLLQLGI
jgi:hypothetical protein